MTALDGEGEDNDWALYYGPPSFTSTDLVLVGLVLARSTLEKSQHEFLTTLVLWAGSRQFRTRAFHTLFLLQLHERRLRYHSRVEILITMTLYHGT